MTGGSATEPFPTQQEREEGEAHLLATLAERGVSFRQVVFTRNRRVMISLADRGRTLRLHQLFLQAPRSIQLALGQLLAARSDPERAAAREAISTYLRLNPPSAPAPRPRPYRPNAADLRHLERLRAEFVRVNAAHFDGALPSVPIRLSGRMSRSNGLFRANPLEIAISRTLCAEALPGEAEQTLRHEMIHLWQFVEGRRPGHGADFRSWARRLGIHPRASRNVCWSPADAAGERERPRR